MNMREKALSMSVFMSSASLLLFAGCETVTYPEDYVAIELPASFSSKADNSRSVVTFSTSNRGGADPVQTASELFVPDTNGFSVEVVSEIDPVEYLNACSEFSTQAGGIIWGEASNYCETLDLTTLLEDVQSDIYSSLTSANNKRTFAEYYSLNTSNMNARDVSHYKNQLPRQNDLNPVLAPNIGKRINFDKLEALQLRYELLGTIFSGATEFDSEYHTFGVAWVQQYNYRTDTVGVDFNFRVTAIHEGRIILDDVFTLSRPVAQRDLCLDHDGSDLHKVCADQQDHGKWSYLSTLAPLAEYMLSDAPSAFGEMHVFVRSSYQDAAHFTVDKDVIRYSPSRLVERPDVAGYLASMKRVSGGRAEFEIAQLGLFEDAPRVLTAPDPKTVLASNENAQYAGDVQRCVIEVRNEMRSEQATGSLLAGIASLAGAGEVASILNTTNQAIATYENLTGEERNRVDDCIDRKGY